MQNDPDCCPQTSGGTLMIDALNGTCWHSTNGGILPEIGPAITAWLWRRLNCNKIPVSVINCANLDADPSVEVEYRRIERRYSFDWDCGASIVTLRQRFSSGLAEKHTWCISQTIADGSAKPCSPSDI
jgi:hypothetical protein